MSDRPVAGSSEIIERLRRRAWMPDVSDVPVPAASPDERLREALDNLLAAVTDVERRGEAGLIEALDDAMNDAADLLAAADREKPETDT